MTLLCPQCKAIVIAPDVTPPADATTFGTACRHCGIRLVITIAVKEIDRPKG